MFARLRILGSLLAGRRRAFGCRQFHSCSTSLGKADGDGLLRRTRAMFSLSHMVDLLANEFSRLGRRGLALTGIFLSSLDGLALWHGISSKSESEYRFGNAAGTIHRSL